MFRRLRVLTRFLMVLAVLLAGVSANAQSETSESPLWITYRLPANPDLRAAATEVFARASRDRNAENVICERSTDVAGCKRQAEKTFRGRLAASHAVTFALYAGPRGGEKAYLFDLSADEPVDPNLDRLFVQADPGSYAPLALSIDRQDESCRFVRQGTHDEAGFTDHVFVDTACFALNLNDEGVSRTPTDMLPLAFVTVGGKVNGARAEFLLAHGANPTPALRAYVRQNEHATTGWVRRLLSAGAVAGDVLRVHNPAIAQLLLEHGANVNAHDPNGGATALIDAMCDVEMTQVLLRNHADVQATDRYGSTALSWNLALGKPSKRHPGGSPRCAAVAAMLRARGAH